MANRLLDVGGCARLHQSLTRAWNTSESLTNDAIAPQHRIRPGSQEKHLQYIWANHFHNHHIWKMEDEVRRVDSPDAVIASLKRSIDRKNQLRNDAIEQIDRELFRRLESSSVVVRDNAETHSETPGAIIDRMSILSLRIYHMALRAERQNLSNQSRAECYWKCNVLHEELSRLTHCLDKLIRDMEHGVIKLICSPRFKMYNDPSLNPALHLNLSTPQKQGFQGSDDWTPAP